MAVPPISIKIESATLRAYLKGVPGAVTRGMHAAAIRAGERFLAHHRRVALRGKKVSSSGPLVGTGKPRKEGQPAVARGGFVSSRTFFIQGTSVDNLTLSMRMKGAGVLHETGGVQTGSGGRMLTIPMPAAKDARGKVTKKARQLLRESKVALRAGEHGLNVFESKFGKKGKVRRRQLRGLLKVTHADGRQFLAHPDPGFTGRKLRGARSKTRLTYLFHLRKSVRVQPRLMFYSTWRAYEPKATEIFRQALPHAIAAAARKGPKGPTIAAQRRADARLPQFIRERFGDIPFTES